MKTAISIAACVVAIAAGSLSFSSMPRDRTIAAFGTSLDGRSHSQRHNSLLALDRLQGAKIMPGQVFSFNHRVGSFSQDQGYRRAPVSYNGQLISDWGGGVCQTSTTLYNAALLAGMTIVERHRHRFAPGYISPGRDAAVAFSNIDLRFRNPYSFPVRIEGSQEGDILVIRLVAAESLKTKPQVLTELRQEQDFQTYQIGARSGREHVRNTGKEGCEVAVYRLSGGQKELISMDTYPAMNRVVQYR
ncbi:MAG: VanW family protein [Fimbriimonas sp.]|nr:VanW family protein [Fimbriimonas sp.]